MMIPAAYQLDSTGPFAGTTHFSPWSYDRHVPLALFGPPFLPGEYHQRVAPVDLAVTLRRWPGSISPRRRWAVC